MTLRIGFLCVIPLIAAGQGCVGTLAGAQQNAHVTIDGSDARGAAFEPCFAAVMDARNPGNFIIPMIGGLSTSDAQQTGRVVLVDRAGTISTLIDGLGINPMIAPTPGGDLLVANDSIILRLNCESRTLSVIAGNASGMLSDVVAAEGSEALGSSISPKCLYSSVDSGDVYFCDGSNLVRVIHASGPTAGLLVTLAGNGGTIRSEIGAIATETSFSDIRDIYLTPSGDLLVAENDEHAYPRIIRVSATDGRVYLIAGSTDFSVPPSSIYNIHGAYVDSAYFVTGAPALGTWLSAVSTLYVQSSTGLVYFSDEYRLAVITSAGTLMILAGQTPSFFSGAIDGTPAATASFFWLTGIRQGDSPSSIVLTDRYSRGAVYLIDLSTGLIHVVAGPVLPEKITPNSTRGGVTATSLSIPPDSINDLAVEELTGNVYFPVQMSGTVVLVTAATGKASVVAGTGYKKCSAADASNATMATLVSPKSIALDGSGGLIIVDQDCCLLFRLDLLHGSLSIIAGDVSVFCDASLDPNVAAENVTTDAPVRSLGMPYFVAVDSTSGDVYWTETAGCRVLVLRRGRGAPKRVAGTGTYSRKLITSSQVALLADLSGPRRITVDGTGAPVFVDGRLPGSILRLDQSGILHVLVSLARAPANTFPVDGSLDRATAFQLYGMTFIGKGQSFLVTEMPAVKQWAIVRRIDLVANTITRIAGAFNGSTDDGRTLLDTRFTEITAIAVYPGKGNFVFAQFDSKVRIAVLSTPEIICPAGYSCQCGTPVPCNDAMYFCPEGSVYRKAVDRGYYAMSVITSSPSTAFYFGQAACPVGSYCVQGLRLSCLAGTYGIARLQSRPSGCERCPVGTFAADPGSVGLASCLPCPPGTYADTPGSSLCTPCPPFTFNEYGRGNASGACLLCNGARTGDYNVSVTTGVDASTAGARECAALSDASLVLAQQFVVVNLAGKLAGAFVDTKPMLVGILVPLAFLAALPMFFLVIRRIILNHCWKFDSCLGNHTAKCISHCDTRLRAFLLRYDMYSLRHRTIDGSHPVKLRTSFGGAWTSIAVGLVLGLGVVLVVEFIFQNVLLTTNLLPADLPTLLERSSVLNHRVDALPPIAHSKTLSGFEIRVSTAGPQCGAPVLAFSSLLAGRFDAHIVGADNISMSWDHAFVCPDCSFGPLSSVTVTFPPTCQSFVMTATAIGATGGISIASTTATSPSAVASVSTETLSLVTVKLQPQLLVLNDTTRGILERGYSVAPTSLVLSTAVDPKASVLQFDLPVNSIYSRTDVIHITTTAQLLSQLIGLIGLISSVGALFFYSETYVSRPRRVLAILETTRRVEQTPSIATVNIKKTVSDGNGDVNEKRCLQSTNGLLNDRRNDHLVPPCASVDVDGVLVAAEHHLATEHQDLEITTSTRTLGSRDPQDPVVQ